MRLSCLSVALIAIISAAGQPKSAISSISICSASGTGVQGSCPSGSSDTQQPVLGPGNTSVNKSTLGTAAAPDEHSTVFAPGTLGSNPDYLFFVASAEGGNGGIGVAVLSGGTGPDSAGKWTLNFPAADGYGSYSGGFGQVFNPATKPDSCPVVADGNPAHQDQTFDLHYAAPGSVVPDPTAPAGNLLMVYEGTNACIGNAGGPVSNTDDYITLGIATSLDYGKSWPTYRGTPSFNFVQMPGLNQTQGPNAPLGAAGANVCEGNNCAVTPPAAYGRYAVITQPVSLASLMAAAQPLTSKTGEQEIAGFVDDVAGTPTYLYATWGTAKVARAQLNGGAAALSFEKWNGSAFASPGLGGAEAGVVPQGPFQNCEAPAQNQFGASISYVEDTQQYLLTFVCTSPGDPALGPGSGSGEGAAWFYATSSTLADQTQWSAPQEIAGSWNPIDSSGGCPDYNGWYPTLMSPGKSAGHLSVTGYVFYLFGCQGAGTPGGRQFSSRAFTITTVPLPVLTTGTAVNGATYYSGGLVPGSWAAVQGSGLSSVTRTWQASDFAGLGNALPTDLSGVQVNVNHLPAALFYIDKGQVNFQVPNGVSGAASIQVINNGVPSNAITAQSSTSSPGIFPVIVNGVNYPAGVFLDGKFTGDPANDAAFRKAKPGEPVQLYATGLASSAAGVRPTPQGVTGVTVTIGKTTVAADFAGLTAAGEFQINFTVPQLADGNYAMTISVNGVSSPVNINTIPPAPILLPIQN